MDGVLARVLGFADTPTAEVLRLLLNDLDFGLAVSRTHHDLFVLGLDGDDVLVEDPTHHAETAASLFAVPLLLVHFVGILAAAEAEEFICVDAVDRFL